MTRGSALGAFAVLVGTLALGRCAVDVVLCFVLMVVFLEIAKSRDPLDLFGRGKCPKGVRVVAEGHGATGGRPGAPQHAERARSHASAALMDVFVMEEELSAEMELARLEYCSFDRNSFCNRLV